MEHPLVSLVSESLNNALAYGYDELLDWSSLAIADDMVRCDSQFEDYDPNALVPYINQWRAGLPPR